MGSPQKRRLVKLVIGCLYNEEPVYARARTSLIRTFGPPDFESMPLAFTHTDYYERELGVGLKKRFISFRKLIAQDSLAAVKLATNRLERSLSHKGLRRINIDPGYLDLAKFILATTKDYRHRIYLTRGIFAEVTLYFSSGSFQPWECTYPDYRSQEYIDILNCIHTAYAKQITSH